MRRLFAVAGDELYKRRKATCLSKTRDDSPKLNAFHKL